MISILLIVTRKQSNEYDIDEIGFPTLFTNDSNPGGRSNLKVDKVAII